MTGASPRAAFEAALGFPLDDFQRRAFDALDAGDSVLVAAPTGAGKTLVAEYAAVRALAAGTKAFYTTPLKALSNQKYGDLVRAHGVEHVGLLTGDNTVRGDAPVVVMTTEVLRNMIYADSPMLHGLEYVVLDEVHYLQDRFRGAVWEEVLIHLPASVRIVALSATVSNAEEFADWIATVRGATTAVIEERRPVELTNLYAVGERGSDSFHLLPVFVPGPGDEPRANPDVQRLDGRPGRGDRRGRPGSRGRLVAPSRVEIVERLAAEQMLPAITFIFSRAGCDGAVDQCLAAGLRLTSADEQRALRRIADAHTAMLSGADLVALGYDAWRAGFEAGLAAHHAGMVPPLKEAVEEAFAAGLVKVVFATETLALGINMPARSVVIEKLSKFTGEHHEFLTPGEYTQLTGRAGRRGIDDRGFAVVPWSPFVPFDQVAGLASRRTYALTSSFRPTYNMTANLVDRCDAAEARHLLNLSFAQFRADRDVVGIERQLERSKVQLEHWRADATCDRGDLYEYRRLTERAGGGARRTSRRSATEEAIGALRPGAVIRTPRGGGRSVVLRHEGGRGSHRLLVLGADGHLVRIGPNDLDAAPVALAHLEIPRPFAPKNPAFRRELAGRLRAARLDESLADLAPDPDDPARHPVAQCPDLDAHLRAMTQVERLERETKRLDRRVRGRSESLARQFDRVLRVLESWGYVDGWDLTPAGRLLMRINAETDLLVAEAVRSGAFDGLRPAEVAALASVFTYEHRGPEHQRPPTPRWSSGDLARRWRTIERSWRDLSANEDDAGLPETRPPDAGLAPVIQAWASGRTLTQVLDLADDLTGGDFVRHVKQLVDLLRQIAMVAPDPATAAAASEAADTCFRGVVAASGVVPV